MGMANSCCDGIPDKKKNQIYKKLFPCNCINSYYHINFLGMGAAAIKHCFRSAADTHYYPQYFHQQKNLIYA